MKTLWTNRTRRAVTLTELLVVLAIVSLLATLAVPVYVQQTERARKAIARAEVRAIAEAEQQVAITHGFYVPINVLDNLPIDTTDTGIRDDMDNTNNTFLPQMNVIDIAQRVDTQRTAGQDDLDTLLNVRINNMVNNWEGPFLNPVRVTERFNPTAVNLNPLTQDETSLDIVLDPWGRPYQFFTSVGVANSFNDDDLNNFDPDTQGDRIAVDDLEISTNFDRFDRFAIVSYGPDGRAEGEPGPALNVFDDIVYQFGSDPNPLTAP